MERPCKAGLVPDGDRFKLICAACRKEFVVHESNPETAIQTALKRLKSDEESIGDNCPGGRPMPTSLPIKP